MLNHIWTPTVIDSLPAAISRIVPTTSLICWPTVPKIFTSSRPRDCLTSSSSPAKVITMGVPLGGDYCPRLEAVLDKEIDSSRRDLVRI